MVCLVVSESSFLVSTPRGCPAVISIFQAYYVIYVADKTNFDGAMAEHALAHKIPDQQVAAYQRTTMVDKRRAMMQTYADYALNTGAFRGNVTQISA